MAGTERGGRAEVVSVCIWLCVRTCVRLQHVLCVHYEYISRVHREVRGVTMHHACRFST